MNFRRLYALLTVVLALTVLGLAGSALVRSQKTWEIDLYSGQEGGVYYPLAKSIAELIEREDSKLKVTVHQSEGSNGNLEILSSAEGAHSIAIVQNDSPMEPAHVHQIRSLTPLHTGALHFIVPFESRINLLGDIQGKKVAVGTKGSGSQLMIRALLLHFGINEVEMVPSSLDQACALLRSGEADAIMMTMGLKSERFERLAEEFPVRLVGLGNGIDPGSEIAGFQLSWPFISGIYIPRYAYLPPSDQSPGVPNTSVPSIGVRAVLMTNRELPVPIARKISRIVSENRSALIRENPETAKMAEQTNADLLQYPLHAGALAYLRRNEPGFLHQNAEVLGFLLSTIATLCGLSMAMKRWFSQRQKDRIDTFYQRLGEIVRKIESHESEPGDRSVLEPIRQELYEIRDTALSLLAEEKLPADESFRIFQDLWDSCIDRLERTQAR